MKFKLDKNVLKNQNLIIVLTVLAATLGSYLTLPSSGFVSTLPLSTIISGLMFFVVDKYYLLPCSFFTITYIFAVLFGTPSALTTVFGGYALRVSFKAAILSLLGCLAVAIIKNKSKIFKKRWATIVIAVVLCAVSLFACFYESGTPWGYIRAKSDIEALIDQRFETNGVSVSSVYGIPGFGSYAVDVEIEGRDEIASVINTNGNLSETVTSLFSKSITDDNSAKLTQILREAVPYESFDVKCEYKGNYSKKLSIKNTETISDYLSYTIDVYSESTAKDFLDTVQKYFDVITNSEFPCNSVTVNGGVRRKMLFTVIGNPYVPGPYEFVQYK